MHVYTSMCIYTIHIYCIHNILYIYNMYVYIYICTYVCMYIYICKHQSWATELRRNFLVVEIPQEKTPGSNGSWNGGPVAVWKIMKPSSKFLNGGGHNPEWVNIRWLCLKLMDYNPQLGVSFCQGWEIRPENFLRMLPKMFRQTHLININLLRAIAGVAPWEGSISFLRNSGWKLTKPIHLLWKISSRCRSYYLFNFDLHWNPHVWLRKSA